MKLTGISSAVRRRKLKRSNLISYRKQEKALEHELIELYSFLKRQSKVVGNIKVV